jgi:hypothetical protein
MKPTVATPPETNDYWEVVKPFATKAMGLFGGHTMIPRFKWPIDVAGDSTFPRDEYGLPYVTEWVDRDALVDLYSWTITHPDTVAFVAAHTGGRVIDPLAGSGWWASLLTAHGVDVYASDKLIACEGNTFHTITAHHPIIAGDAPDVVAAHGQDRTLLLSWPPYEDPVGAQILRAYTGPRVIYIGTERGGCCGDDAMFDELYGNFEEVDVAIPVRFDAFRDVVAVYERNPT